MPEPREGAADLSDLRVIVTGARGFIGTHTMTALKLAGADPISFQGDVRDAASWSERFDVVIHLAAALPSVFRSHPDEGYTTNVTGTLNALEACSRYGATMVFASTCGVYDASLEGELSESSPVRPGSPYAVTKRIGEMLCESYASDERMTAVALRLFNVFGLGQSSDFLIPYLVASAVSGPSPTVYHPESARDFVHADDVARAFVAAAESRRSGIYNVGTGVATTVREVLQAIEHEISEPLAWQQGQTSGDAQPTVRAKIARSAEELGWSPCVTWREGLVRQIEKARVLGGG